MRLCDWICSCMPYTSCPAGTIEAMRPKLEHGQSARVAAMAVHVFATSAGPHEQVQRRRREAVRTRVAVAVLIPLVLLSAAVVSARHDRATVVRCEGDWMADVTATGRTVLTDET